MRYIITHTSPDWDAIASVWIIKKYLPGWNKANVEFVQPGDKSKRVRNEKAFLKDIILKEGEDEMIHVDTGNSPLDHHLTPDVSISSALNSWQFIKSELEAAGNKLTENHEQAITRMMKIVTMYDHFQDIFFPESESDFYDFSLNGLLDGLKLEKPGEDDYFVEFGGYCLNAIFHKMENKIWVEKEIKEEGIEFETRFGKGIGLETVNHAVLKVGQRMGYVIVFRKDPRNGYLAIASRPEQDPKKKVDLTLVYEQLKKMDTEATWYFHISRQLLMNGSTRGEETVPTKLSLQEIISVVKGINK